MVDPGDLRRRAAMLLLSAGIARAGPRHRRTMRTTRLVQAPAERGRRARLAAPRRRVHPEGPRDGRPRLSRPRRAGARARGRHRSRRRRRAPRHLAYLSRRATSSTRPPPGGAALALDPADGDARACSATRRLEIGRYDARRRVRRDDAAQGRSVRRSRAAPRSRTARRRPTARSRICALRRRGGRRGRSASRARASRGRSGSSAAEQFAIGELAAAEARVPGVARARCRATIARSPASRRCASAQRRRDEAIELYERAIAVVPMPEYAVGARRRLHACRSRRRGARRRTSWSSTSRGSRGRTR